MICDKCKGKGYCENPHQYQVSGVIAWERGYTDGFVIGNADEIIKALDIAIRNGQPLTLRELKQIRLALNK